eukprot:1157679-Pelagomonas_calceolata.AAC.12
MASLARAQGNMHIQIIAVESHVPGKSSLWSLLMTLAKVLLKAARILNGPVLVKESPPLSNTIVMQQGVTCVDFMGAIRQNLVILVTVAIFSDADWRDGEGHAHLPAYLQLGDPTRGPHKSAGCQPYHLLAWPRNLQTMAL